MTNLEPKNYSPKRLFVLVAASIFIVEFAIMIAFQYIFGPTPPIENLLDASTLVIITYPVIYIYFFRPMQSEITRRQAAEKQLLSHSLELEKFKLVVDNISEYIVITDPEGTVTFANPAAEKITGFSTKEIMGKKAGSSELWGGRMDKEFYQKLWHIIKDQKQTFSAEVKNRRKNGQDYLAYSIISPVMDNRGNVEFFVEIQRDITREKEIDRAKTEFVSLASHQLRTPTTAINWFSKMLLNGEVGKLNREQKQYLQNVYDGNKRMIGLIAALLDVSRIELGTFAIKPEIISLPEICDNLLTELKPQIDSKKIKIALKYDPLLPKISADPKLTYIIFQNLLTNAISYSHPKSTITITISVEQSQKDSYFLIAVKDTGIGISTAEQDKIFTKLFRTDNARETVPDGTGLGLYIVKSILEHAGGAVWFESQENKGSTFYAKLPLEGMRQQQSDKALI